MSIEVVCTPYGLPATKRLGERIDALKGGDPLAPVTVVVPTNIAGIATRRALGARDQGITAVNFLKLFDLAERLAGRQMAVELKRKPLSDPVLSATVRSVLNTNPGLFRASAQHPATQQALVRSYRDLRELSENQLNALATQSRRAADVVRICGQVRSRLESKWYDGQDLNELSINTLGSGSFSDLVQQFGPVIIHLPQRVTRSQGLMVSSLSAATSVAVIAGLTGNAKADSAVAESVRRMGADFVPPRAVSQPHGQRIISTASADEEVRVAVREVVDAARDGIALNRIAVLCGSGEPVIRALHSHLNAADIPYNGPSGRTLADSLAGRGLIALLNLVGRDFRRNEVFALLSVASATDTPLAVDGKQPSPAAAAVMAWERVSRQAGVARGSEQWETRLNSFAADQREAARQEEGDPDGIEGRVERRRREADHAESLARFMAQLIGDLSPDPEPASWKDWCGWIKRLIHTYLGDEKARQQWPPAEQEAGDKIEGILDRLANLDEIEHRPRSTTFRHTLVSELGAPTGRVGRVGYGVLTEQIGASLGMELDRVILIGMAEGTFPHSPSDDPLLPDRERMAASDDLSLLSDRMSDQHRGLLAVLASAETAALVYARGDARRASEQHPSRWVLDTASVLAGRVVDSTNLGNLADNDTAGWFEHVPSFAGRVLHAEFPATAQEFRLQALAQTSRSDDLPIDDDPVLTRGAELVASRASNQFTRFDGNLSHLEVADLISDVVSPTSLETWADCPMRYLFQHVLRVQTFEQPEELLQISALEKGSLVHDALDMFVREQLDNDQVPPPGQPWSEQQRRRLLEIGAELCEQVEARGLTGTSVYWHHDRRRILTDLERFLSKDDAQRRRYGVTAAASELAFGMPDAELGAVAITLRNGRNVRFRGRADRVDHGADDRLLVTDYKTGKADSYKDLDEGSRNWDPVLRGTKLQLPVYGLAARDNIDDPDAQVRTQYWFVTSDQQFKTCGYWLTDRVMDRFRTVVDTITKGIEGGVFCDRPQPDRTEGPYSQYCDYCNADRLGTQERRRGWENMQDQTELADYRHLAESPHGLDSEAN
ncbi:PD-(D/E)XK nuclease family protein [Candidatus Poriferisocius sp.]|uniref:PD-(D/E)XK nuclease family protein n=1 Tax=Candidatus Poriferisocius sp. TaxID=3101276 RepID=UPI003B019875